MTGLEHAVLGLRQALESPGGVHSSQRAPRYRAWRWLVRQRMAAVRDALVGEHRQDDDAWLAAREIALQRERVLLVGRLAELGRQVLEAPDVEPVRQALLRLVTDLEHHRQRLNDLVYDSVSLELGGSE